MRPTALVLIFLSFLAAASHPAAAGIAQPLADINMSVEPPGEPLFFNPDFVAIGSSVLYMTDDGIHGLEMWKSDGTLAGTQLVADVCPGACGSRPSAVTSTGGLVFFAADDGAHGREVWRTDGTRAGTWMVKDIWPGVGGSFIGLQMAAAGGGVFFAADDGGVGAELWQSDGTAAGTVLVKDIRPGALGSQPGVRVTGNGRLLFTADDGVHGREPWISNGTAAGTEMAADINPAGDSTYFSSAFLQSRENLALASGSFLFTAHDDVHGDELWTTDGTPAATVRLGGGGPNELTEMGGTIYFSAVSDGEGYELWKTDGTPAGTGMLVAIRPGSGNSTPLELTRAGSRIFFRAFDDAHGQELWVTDGTAAGTVLVKDLRPGVDWSFPIVSRQGFLFVLPSGFFFFADDGVHGTSLWQTDGTAAGTVLVHDFSSQEAPATLFFYMGALTLGSRYYFRGVSLAHGYELWSTDGTSAGTGEVANVGRMTPSIFLSPFTGAPPEPTSWGPLGSTGSRLLFEANDGTSGGEPWAGSPGAGVTFLADTLPGSDFSSLREVTPFGVSTLFSSSNGSSGGHLWKTDGTPAGTAPSGAPAGDRLTPFAGAVVYVVSEAATGAELWRTDGTAGGSALIKDIRPGTEGSAPSGLTVSGGSLFFAADDGTNGRELWKSDGTPGGTVQVKDIRTGPAAANLGFLLDAAGTLFFAADDGVNGRALWKSDGTPGGTVLVSAVPPGASPLTQEVFQPGSALAAAVGSTLFFVAVDGTSGEELWKSDGTPGGTVLVKDIQPGPGGAEPRWLTAAGGRLFFSADDGVHGRELWVSDGTAAGTVLLDLEPGPGSSLPRELTAVGSAIVFSAFETASGVEPWVSDGTMLGTGSGTRRLDDIAPGILPSSPSQFRAVGSAVYFAANDGNTGAEPWWIARNAVSPEPLAFYTLTPCRAVDTRSTSPLASGEVRTLPLAASCGIPADAKAVAVNLTILDAAGTGHLTAWPSAAPEPATSVLNFVPGKARANNAILALGGGAVDVQAAIGGGGSVQMLLDVCGYFQ